MLNRLGMTKNTMILEGYLPEREVTRLVNELEQRFRVAITISEPEEDEDVPVLLENNGFSSPVEPITEMYALPAKKDIDPTPVMAVFYYLFFGLMLSDAGYGCLMVLVSALALKKFPLEGNSANDEDVSLFRRVHHLLGRAVRHLVRRYCAGYLAKTFCIGPHRGWRSGCPVSDR